MSSYVTQPGSEKASYQDVIEPVAAAAATTGAWINAGLCCNWLAHVGAGTVGTSVDFKIQQATDSSGTGAKDISGLAITQLVAAGSALINIVQGDLDVTNDFTHIAMVLTTVGATTVASAELIGLDARNEPLAQGAEIDETIS